jgi:hypothetical protein
VIEGAGVGGLLSQKRHLRLGCGQSGGLLSPIGCGTRGGQDPADAKADKRARERDSEDQGWIHDFSVTNTSDTDRQVRPKPVLAAIAAP